MNHDSKAPAQTGSTPRESTRQATTTSSLVERLARALAPTIFCPDSRVDQCIREMAQAGLAH
jgi:hypothetical protein